MGRRFTKYPSNYIKANTEFTDIYNEVYNIVAENDGSTYKARLYLDDLVRRGVLSKADAATMVQDVKETYDLWGDDNKWQRRELLKQKRQGL